MILVDAEMPEMDGFEATERIRKGEAGEANARLPIVAMTAHAMKGDEQKCIDAGCDGYITKPIDRKKIEQVIRENLNKKTVSKSQST